MKSEQNVIYSILLAHSHYENHNLTELWFRLKNPMFTNSTPIDLINYGRSDMLVKMLEEATNED